MPSRLSTLSSVIERQTMSSTLAAHSSLPTSLTEKTSAADEKSGSATIKVSRRSMASPEALSLSTLTLQQRPLSRSSSATRSPWRSSVPEEANARWLITDSGAIVDEKRWRSTSASSTSSQCILKTGIEISGKLQFSIKFSIELQDARRYPETAQIVRLSSTITAARSTLPTTISSSTRSNCVSRLLP